MGGGQGSFIGKVHSIAGVLDNRASLVAGAQISSMQLAIPGNISLTSTPDFPCLLNLKGDCINPPVFRSVDLFAISGRWPLYFIKEGFGSKVSTWEGPPFMKRWIKYFAFGLKCGSLGFKGFALEGAAFKKPESERNDYETIVSIQDNNEIESSYESKEGNLDATNISNITGEKNNYDSVVDANDVYSLEGFNPNYDSTINYNFDNKIDIWIDEVFIIVYRKKECVLKEIVSKKFPK